MSGGKIDFDEVAEARDDADDPKRNERSTISFPYMDLEAAIEVARGVYSRAGLGACDVDELAAQMGQTLSGAFRQKTSAAKTFGLVEKDGRAAFKLTSLGSKIVAPETEREARADAFLAVPLYAKIFEDYRGHNLPPPRALERVMEKLGVSSKQTDKARQAFDRSARQAGFFEAGEDRLVRPRLSGTERAEVRTPPGDHLDPEKQHRQPRNGGGGDGGGADHPFIMGLLKTLPESGKTWSAEDRVTWLTLAANAFDLLYGRVGEISVRVAPKDGRTAEQN